MNENPNLENINNEFGRVAQLDEHKPSKFADTGSNPATVICDICGEVFASSKVKANHIRWKHIEPTKSKDAKVKSQKWLDAMAARKGHGTNQYTKAKELGLPNPIKDETRKKFSESKKGNRNPAKRAEVKAKISETQRHNSYRRIMRHTQEYNGVLFDSSWEVELAKRLDTINEVFERPKSPIVYIGEDKQKHNYFPDFYLPKRKIFIEVKNPYLFENDSKVQILKAERSDIIWLTSLEQIQKFE